MAHSPRVSPRRLRQMLRSSPPEADFYGAAAGESVAAPPWELPQLSQLWEMPSLAADIDRYFKTRGRRHSGARRIPLPPQSPYPSCLASPTRSSHWGPGRVVTFWEEEFDDVKIYPLSPRKNGYLKCQKRGNGRDDNRHWTEKLLPKRDPDAPKTLLEQWREDMPKGWSVVVESTYESAYCLWREAQEVMDETCVQSDAFYVFAHELALDLAQRCAREQLTTEYNHALQDIINLAGVERRALLATEHPAQEEDEAGNRAQLSAEGSPGERVSPGSEGSAERVQQALAAEREAQKLDQGAGADEAAGDGWTVPGVSPTARPGAAAPAPPHGGLGSPRLRHVRRLPFPGHRVAVAEELRDEPAPQPGMPQSPAGRGAPVSAPPTAGTRRRRNRGFGECIDTWAWILDNATRPCRTPAATACMRRSAEQVCAATVGRCFSESVASAVAESATQCVGGCVQQAAEGTRAVCASVPPLWDRLGHLIGGALETTLHTMNRWSMTCGEQAAHGMREMRNPDSRNHMVQSHPVLGSVVTGAGAADRCLASRLNCDQPGGATTAGADTFGPVSLCGQSAVWSATCCSAFFGCLRPPSPPATTQQHSSAWVRPGTAATRRGCPPGVSPAAFDML
eukprot:TRINITY_DN36495_c0_g1_i1.p1 TRINITY_DN36495_c0_g1~~TRINITY_DN36495_c0_g1_i1.p1  ORF type:complete len:624 (+),score=91.28 TRINITY_DN36495_c0_g1_i1:91-1962(+)